MPLRAKKVFQSRFSADFRELDVLSNFIRGNFKACADGLGNFNCHCVPTPRCEFHNYITTTRVLSFPLAARSRILSIFF